MFCTPEPPNCAQRIEKTHLSEGELTIMPPLEVEREKKHISLKICMETFNEMKHIDQVEEKVQILIHNHICCTMCLKSNRI